MHTGFLATVVNQKSRFEMGVAVIEAWRSRLKESKSLDFSPFSTVFCICFMSCWD